MTTYFVAMGLCAGVWVARIPAVKQQAHLTDTRLGLALLAVPVGLLAGTIMAGRVVDRTGSAKVTRFAGVANCLLLIPPGFARNIDELIVALLAIGFSGGMLDVAQNAQGVRIETAYGRPIMSSMHAGYSLGAIVGSLTGGAFAWAGIAPAPTLAAIGIPGAIVTAVAGRWLLSAREEESRPVPSGLAPESGGLADRGPRVGTTVLALGILAICGLVGEGAAGDWSAVYLRDNLGTSAGFAALGYAAFSVTMTVGRFTGDRLIARFGILRVSRACGLIAGVGLAAGLLAGWAGANPDSVGAGSGRVGVGSGLGSAARGVSVGVGAGPMAAVAGFALLGAGLSVIVPRVFAAGGRADPVRPGRGLATVVGMGYAGMTGGPPVIGLVAGRVGLPLALGIPALLALWIAAGAAVLGREGLSVPGAGRIPEREAVAEDVAPTLGKKGAPGTAGGAPAYGRSMDDKEILGHIDELIQTEHELRSQLAAGQLSSVEERERLRSAERALDQCWDLLRQRRARREFGENPDAAEVRPTAEVEGYQQ